MITGKADTNIATTTITFTADRTGRVVRLTPMGPADADEQGHYHCHDEDGREWLLIDYEDGAELHAIRESEYIGPIYRLTGPIEWLHRAGDWDYGIAPTPTGFVAVWVGGEPLADDTGRIVCPTDEDAAGDRTGAVAYDSREGAIAHIEGIIEAIDATA